MSDHQSSSPRMNQMQPPLSKYSVFRHTPCSAWASTDGLDQYHASKMNPSVFCQESEQILSITSRGSPDVPPAVVGGLSKISSPQLNPGQGWDDQIAHHQSAPLASQFTESYALMPDASHYALDSTWDSSPPQTWADESAWNEGNRTETLQHSTKSFIPDPQRSQSQGKQHAHQSYYSAYSSKPSSSRVSATTIDVPLFLQPFAYDPETAPPLPSRPSKTSIHEQQISSTKISHSRRLSPPHPNLLSNYADKSPTSQDNPILRCKSGLPVRSGDNAKRQDPSSKKTERSSGDQNLQDSSLMRSQILRHDEEPKTSSSECSSPCNKPASRPPSHGRNTSTLIFAVHKYPIQQEVAEDQMSPDRPSHQFSQPQDEENCGPDRRLRDIKPVLSQPLDIQNNGLSLQDGSTSTTDLSSTRAGLSTPESQLTSTTSYHENGTQIQTKSRARQAGRVDDSFYWHSGRSSSDGEEEEEEEEEQHETESRRRLSARSSTEPGSSTATTDLTVRPKSQLEITSLPMRSTSLTHSSVIAPYGASVLGFGGPSDWEYFGDYEAEEVDDEELYTRPRPPAELPAGSVMPQNDRPTKDSDYHEVPPSETDTLTELNIVTRDTLQNKKEGVYLVAGNESSMVQPKLHTPHGPARLNNSWNKDDRALSIYDQRPDMDDIIRAWSEAPFVGKESRRSTNLQTSSNDDVSHDKFADASLASTPQDRFLGIDVILKDAPEIPKLPDSIEQLSPSYHVAEFERMPLNDDVAHRTSEDGRLDSARASTIQGTPGVPSIDEHVIPEDVSSRMSRSGAQKDEIISEPGSNVEGPAANSSRHSQDGKDAHGGALVSLTESHVAVANMKHQQETQMALPPTPEMSNMMSQPASMQKLVPTIADDWHAPPTFSLEGSLTHVERLVDQPESNVPLEEPRSVEVSLSAANASHAVLENATENPSSPQSHERRSVQATPPPPNDDLFNSQDISNSPVSVLKNPTDSHAAILEASAKSAACKGPVMTDASDHQCHEHVASIAPCDERPSSSPKAEADQSGGEETLQASSPENRDATHRPEAIAASQNDPQLLQKGHLAMDRVNDAGENASSDLLLNKDPYADLDPWSKASLNRFAAMLREEARADHHRDKLNIFNVFTSRESRLRVILYGADDDLILPREPDQSDNVNSREQQNSSRTDEALLSAGDQSQLSTVRQDLQARQSIAPLMPSQNSTGKSVRQVQGGFVKQVVERANVVGLQQSLKALPALPKRRGSVDYALPTQIKIATHPNSNKGAQQPEATIWQPLENQSNGASATSPPDLPGRSVTPAAVSENAKIGTNDIVDLSQSQSGSNALKKLSTKPEILSHLRAHSRALSGHRGEDQSEVNNYLTNRRSIYRPFASHTLETLDKGSSFGRERSLELENGAVSYLAGLRSKFNAPPQVNEAVETTLQAMRPNETHVAASDQPELRQFVDADFDPLIMVLPRSEAVIDDAGQLQDLENVMEAIPEDFTFIHASVLSWDMKIRKQREENDRQRHERQVNSEKRIDALFNDHEIGYGDISELEAEFKRNEAARRADEDRTEYQSFVAEVFNLVWARLHFELDQLSPHYERCSNTMDDTLAGKDMFDQSESGMSLARTMTQFLALHQKIEIRHQKAFEAVLERDRRLKKTEISPWYTLNNIAKVKQIEKQFEDAEKKAIIEYCEQRDERANRLMDVLDQNTLRGVGANQDYMEAIMKAVRRIASGRAFASLPGTNIAGVAEVQKAQMITALLATSSEEIVRTFHLADMLLNSADYEVSVAKAKVAKADMATLSQLKEERAKEDMKLMRELEHRLALVREDSRRTNDEIIKLKLFLGLQDGRAMQSAPRAMGMHMRGGSLEANDAQIEARSHDDRSNR